MKNREMDAEDHLANNSEEGHSGVNQESYALMDEMYNSLSYIDKDGDHWATSIEEADLAEELINKAEQEMQDPADTELRELIDVNRNHVNDIRKRRFAGAWWLIILAGIVVIYNFYTANKTLGDRMTEAGATSSIESQKGYLKQTIDRYESKEGLEKAEKKHLKKAKKDYKELDEMTAKKYASNYRSRRIKSGLSGILGGIIGLFWVVGYYFAARPYGYMRCKRQKEYQIIQKATGWGAAIISGILGVFMSIPITTYITKFSDGSKETSSDALGVLAIQVIVVVGIVVSVLYVASVAIPFVAIIAYIRNFPDGIGAKQIHGLFGESRGFVEKYVDKLKMKTV